MFFPPTVPTNAIWSKWHYLQPASSWCSCKVCTKLLFRLSILGTTSTVAFVVIVVVIWCLGCRLVSFMSFLCVVRYPWSHSVSLSVSQSHIGNCTTKSLSSSSTSVAVEQWLSHWRTTPTHCCYFKQHLLLFLFSFLFFSRVKNIFSLPK